MNTVQKLIQDFPKIIEPNTFKPYLMVWINVLSKKTMVDLELFAGTFDIVRIKHLNKVILELYGSDVHGILLPYIQQLKYDIINDDEDFTPAVEEDEILKKIQQRREARKKV